MQKVKLQFKILFLFSVLCFLSFFSLPVLAAVLYLEPSDGEYQPGDSFSVKIKLDTEGECINAVEANLNFSKNVLKAIDFSRGESILSLWIKSPEINQEKGEISFSGGIPGGYCGRIPGDPGASNLLGKIIFGVPGMMVQESGENTAEIKFSDNSQALLNDGLGTPAKLTFQGATFKILSKGESLKEEWKEELIKDKVPPEPFAMGIQKDPAIFDGKYFIVFSTTDKQTGIDYYEISETRDNGQEKWKKSESPYLLEDQNLKSIIKVRAIDKAGNERIAEYAPPKESFLRSYWKIIILILFLIGGIVWLCWKFRKK